MGAQEGIFLTVYMTVLKHISEDTTCQIRAQSSLNLRGALEQLTVITKFSHNVTK